MDTDPLQNAGRASHYRVNKNKSVYGDNLKAKCQNVGFGVNIVICVLCIVSVSSSIWREYQLKNRVAILEDKVELLEIKSVDAIESVVERVRRDAVYQLKRRYSRDILAVLGQPGSTDEVPLVRATREAPECLCPAGKSLTTRKY